jgi:hypothetical protein
VDGGAGGGWFIAGGGGGGCARRVTLAFTFFGTGLPALAAVGGRLDAGTFLLGGARALPGACVAVALVCSVGRGGTKRARAAAVGLPASLGFATWGGGGRWNGVGRGRWGAQGRVHRRDCAGGRVKARIGRWGGEARGEVSARGFFAPASTDAAR